MPLLNALFSVDFVIFRAFSYEMSLCELIGTLSGMACVVWAARARILTWPLGLVNALFFLVLFYQVRLYADMALQVFFIASTAYGWYRWARPRSVAEADKRDELKVSALGKRERSTTLVASLAAALALGLLSSRAHVIMPAAFPEPAAFPYLDSLTTVFSVTAQILMTRKKRECWPLWLACDAVDMVIYALQGVWLVAAEYLVFAIIAAAGWLEWNRIERGYRAAEEA